MPIYEYQCNDCGHRLEALQAISDDPLTDCPECEAAALRRLVSASAFRLKGGGWYETDFKQSGQRNLAGDSSGKSDGAGKKGDGKGDAAADKGKKKDATKKETGKSSTSNA